MNTNGGPMKKISTILCLCIILIQTDFSMGAPTDLNKILEESCKGESRESLQKYLKDGDFKSRLNDSGARIWLLDELHHDVKEGFGESKSNFDCLNSLYKKSLEDVSDYWVQRGLKENCFTAGSDIPKTKPSNCPQSTWDELNNSLSYHDSLKSDYEGFLTQMKSRANTAMVGAKCATSAEKNMDNMKNLRFTMCCQTLKDGGFIDKNQSEEDLNKSCHAMIDQSGKEPTSTKKVMSCAIDGAGGLFSALKDLLMAVPALAKMLVTGELGSFIGQEYWEYTQDTKGYYDKIVAKMSTQFEGVLDCMSPQERQDFLCRNIPYGITLLLPGSAARLAMSSAKTMLKINKVSAAMSKGKAFLNKPGGVVEKFHAYADKPISVTKQVLNYRIEAGKAIQSVRSQLSEKLKSLKKPTGKEETIAKSPSTEPKLAGSPTKGESLASKNELATNQVTEGGGGGKGETGINESAASKKSKIKDSPADDLAKNESQSTIGEKSSVAERSKISDIEAASANTEIGTLVEDLAVTEAAMASTLKPTVQIVNKIEQAASSSPANIKTSPHTTPIKLSPKGAQAKKTIEDLDARLALSDSANAGKHFEMQKVFGDKKLSSRRVVEKANEYHEAVETLRHEGQISGERARDLHDSISIAESYAKGSNQVRKFNTTMYSKNEIAKSSKRIQTFQEFRTKGDNAVKGPDGRDYIRAFGEVNGDLKNTRRVSDAAKQHHRDIDILRENGDLTHNQASALHEDVSTIEYLATGRNSRSVASVLNNRLERGSFLQVVEDLPITEAEIEMGAKEIAQLPANTKINTKNSQTFYHKFKNSSITFIEGGKIVLSKGKKLYEVTSQKVKMALNNWKISRMVKNTTSYGRDPEFVSKLRKNNLLPKHTIEVKGVNYHITDIINTKNGRKVAFAIIETGKTRTFQTLVSSNSQGTFRVIPVVVVDEQGEVAYLSKGLASASIEVPNEVDALLGQKLLKNEVRTDISKTTGDELLIGSVPDTLFPTDGEHPLAYEFLGLREKLLLQDKNLNTIHANDVNVKPENIRIANRDFEPDFSKKPVLEYKTTTELSGEVKAQVFRSRDGSIEYTVFKDKEEKIWIAKITDTTAAINNSGIRKEYFSARNILQPRWEYPEQIPGTYAGASNPINGKYADNWDYLKRIPVIKDYYLQQGLNIPN